METFLTPPPKLWLVLLSESVCGNLGLCGRALWRTGRWPVCSAGSSPAGCTTSCWRTGRPGQYDLKREDSEWTWQTLRRHRQVIGHRSYLPGGRWTTRWPRGWGRSSSVSKATYWSAGNDPDDWQQAASHNRLLLTILDTSSPLKTDRWETGSWETDRQTLEGKTGCETERNRLTCIVNQDVQSVLAV